MAKIKEEADGRDELQELQPGATLLDGQFTILKYINSGGFGITYLAKNNLDREIVIKECFPRAFCQRRGTSVSPRSRTMQNEFLTTVRLFLLEAKNLSKLVHPNIVGVHQLFEDNGTAYMALDYIQGRDLLDIIEDDRAWLTPPRVSAMLQKLLGALSFVHSCSVLHRDISPDNILVDNTGKPILIDFGAAKQRVPGVTKALSAMHVVKDSYSPQEYYVAGTNQSDASDLYALAATFYHAIRGITAPNSQQRLLALAEGAPDPYQTLAGDIPGYPDGFLEEIDRAMNVLPKKRPQSAREWLGKIDQRLSAKVVALRPLSDRSQIPKANDDSDIDSTISAVIAESVARSKAAERQAETPSAVNEPMPDPAPQPLLAVEEAAPEPKAEFAPLRREPKPHLSLLAVAAAVILAVGLSALQFKSGTVPDVVAEAPLMPSVLIARTDWEADTPFDVAGLDVSGRSFPQISAVPEGTEMAKENAWVEPGVIIYSINGNWAADLTDIGQTLLGSGTVGGDSLVYAAVRIKRNRDAALEDQTLAVPVRRHIETVDGIKLVAEMVDGLWQTVVTEVAKPIEGGVQVGDILTSESVTGEEMTAPDAFEATLATLSRDKQPLAIFTVSRAGVPTVVKIKLTGSN